MSDQDQLLTIKNQLDHAIKEKKSKLPKNFSDFIKKMSIFIGKPLNMMSTHLEQNPYFEYLLTKIEEYARSGKSWVYTQLKGDIYLFSEKGKPLYSFGADAHVGNYLNPFEPHGDAALTHQQTSSIGQTSSDGVIYDHLLNYKKKISNDFLKYLDRINSCRRSFDFLNQNTYPCVMIEVQQTTLPFSKKLNEKDLWANMVCSFITGLCNYESFYKNAAYSYGIEMHRRGGFGFNQTTIAQTKSSVRINLGLVPQEYLELCALSIEQLNRSLPYLKYMETSINAFPERKLFFTDKNFQTHSPELYISLNKLRNKGLTFSELLYEPISSFQSEKAYDLILKSAGGRDYMNAIVTEKLRQTAKPSKETLDLFKTKVLAGMQKEYLLFLSNLYHDLKIDEYDLSNRYSTEVINLIQTTLLDETIDPNSYDVVALSSISSKISSYMNELSQNGNGSLTTELFLIKNQIDKCKTDKANTRKKRKAQLVPQVIKNQLLTFQKNQLKSQNEYKLLQIREKITELRQNESASIELMISKLNELKIIIASTAGIRKKQEQSIPSIDLFIEYIQKIRPIDLNEDDLKLLISLEAAIIEALSALKIKNLSNGSLSLSFCTPTLELPESSKPFILTTDAAYLKVANDITNELEKKLSDLIAENLTPLHTSLSDIDQSTKNQLIACVHELKQAVLSHNFSIFNSKFNMFNELLFIYSLVTTPFSAGYQSDSDVSIEVGDFSEESEDELAENTLDSLDAISTDDSDELEENSEIIVSQDTSLTTDEGITSDSYTDDGTDADDEFDDIDEDSSNDLDDDFSIADSTDSRNSLISNQTLLINQFMTKNYISTPSLTKLSTNNLAQGQQENISLQITEISSSEDEPVAHPIIQNPNKIYAKKATLHNGMLCIFTAVSIALKMQAQGKRKIAALCPYYEYPEMMKQLKSFSAISGITLRKPGLEFENSTDISNANVLFADLSPCFTKKSYQVLNVKEQILSSKAEILIIDTTSSVSSEVKEIIANLSKHNTTTKAVILVESGLKHGEQGADKMHYGSIRIWSKDKDYIDEFLTAIPQRFKPLTALHHHYRRILKKFGATTSNVYYSKKIRSIMDKSENMQPCDEGGSPPLLAEGLVLENNTRTTSKHKMK